MIGEVALICFNGPESTGKSYMAERLAKRFNTEFVPEVAREFISSNDFSADDILAIGREQTARVFAKAKTANKVLFCDTDLITTRIYSQLYLGQTPNELSLLEDQIRYDLYFLFDIDIPWVADGLRDLGHRREEVMSIFIDELEKRNILYTLVSGSFAEREQIIIEKIRATFHDVLGIP